MEYTYAYRKSAYDTYASWTTSSTELHYHGEKVQRHIPYSSILEVRIQLQPYFRYRKNNVACIITTQHGEFQILSTHYVDFAEFEDRADTFTPFVKVFVSNLIAKYPNCPICIGQKPAAFWGNIALILAAFVLVYVGWTWLPLSNRALPIALLLLAGWSYLKMSSTYNRPRRLREILELDEILPVKSDS